MRGLALITSTVIAFAASALAAPAIVADILPRSNALEKRGWPVTWYFPAANETFTPWKKLGCYSGDTALWYNTGMCSCNNAAWKKESGAAMPFSMGLCFAYCKGAGFRFAGIKGDSGVKSCLCGNGVTDDDKLSNESKCDVPCGEGEGGTNYDVSKCGGKTTFTIYQDPCYKEYDPGEAAAGYDYVGCFYFAEATVLPYWIGSVSDNLSVDSCLEHCASKGFAYSGMTASGGQWTGDQCWCGGKIANYWIQRHKDYPADNNGCTYLCSASAKVQHSIAKEDYQYCGAPWYMSIYFNPNLAESDTCNAEPPKVTTTISTGGKEPGTTTKTGEKTDTVIITTTVDKTTVTTTLTDEEPGTTTVEGDKTDTVIITVTPEGPKPVTTITTPGTKPGTTTKTGPKTDTVVITEPPKKTVTTTVTDEEPGTTTEEGDKTDTVIITVTPEGPKPVTTITTPGTKPGTTTKTGPKTDTVVITEPPKKTVTTTVTGDEPGTTTEEGDKTDTVVITTTPKPTEPGPKDVKETVTTTVTDEEPGTTTKTGVKTDTVIITVTPATEKPTDTPEDDKVTITTTVTGYSPGTTTKTGVKTDTVVITVPGDKPTGKVTVTTTVTAEEPGTTTKTGDKTDTVIITVPGDEQPTDKPEDEKVTITTTVSGEKPGTTTKTGVKTDTVVITTPGEEKPTGKVTVTTTVTAEEPGTTTKTGDKTDTVIITIPGDEKPTGKVTITTTVTAEEPGTTTKTGDKTDTVIITVPGDEKPTEKPDGGKETVTQTTPGPTPGTTTVVGDKTDTVIITTPASSPPAPTGKITVTTTVPGENPGTTTKTGAKTDTVVITTKTTPANPIKTQPPADSCCIMPMASDSEKKKGFTYPLGGFKPSIVWTPDAKSSYTLIRLAGINTNCRTSYKYTIEDFQSACWNGCMEQQKKCYAEYTKQKVCSGSGRKKTCYSSKDLKAECDKQYAACKLANTNTKKDNNPLKDAMAQCPNGPKKDEPEDDGYGDDGYY
ncbi:hypothetical protein H072_6833 [Dactylellina haptotyla CBS 200.50]|uniref:WSC domain-containing protein n=1 Tax=Dactylellina haptotyla (strain CBS 200.50) TaxID=1284197 RepID=S8BJE0_DACHA|nr:hypothetical protein H072_6833 [Dactylellina haptotyla CBS 200.50]